MDEYFETFGGIRDYLDGVVDEARKAGFTETIWGRRRYLPDLTSDNRHAPRDGRADGAQRPHPGLRRRPDQGRDAQRRPGDPGERPRPHGCCSRSTTSSCSRWPTGERDALETLVREQMAGAADLTVPLDVSVGTGHSWHEAAH